jgi:hypothetical protein
MEMEEIEEMEDIWQTLPNDLVIYVFTLCEGLPIDLRLQFKIAPHRLPKTTLDMRFSRTWRYDIRMGEYHTPINISGFSMSYILTSRSRICAILGKDDVTIFDLDKQLVL